MVDENGRWLEEEIAAYMKYRLPELAVSGSGVLKEAEQVKKAGDFHTLYDPAADPGVGAQAGKAGQAVEKSLKTIRRKTRVKLAMRQMKRERLHLRGMRLF